MFWNRGNAWEDDGEDVLEQGRCLGGRWEKCSGTRRMLGGMTVRMFWNREGAWEDDGGDVLEQRGCLGG